jgi:quercetin dioxygenase-like cupin family protein
MRDNKRALALLGLAGAVCCGALSYGEASSGKKITMQTTSQTAMKRANGTTDASGVMYFPQQETAAAFKDSVMLYDGVPEKNYRVAVYHRDKGGEVEIHKKDTDVFYILEGSATFVTGGTITGGKETAVDEVRVATMEGGVARKVGKGDVIIVPANVTHWYKEVQQPITYFGVKVR